MQDSPPFVPVSILEGVSQLCFEVVAVHMDVSRWNSTNQFRGLKGLLKNQNHCHCERSEAISLYMNQ